MKLDQATYDKKFLDEAFRVATQSTCVRADRKVGSVIVKNNRILARGANGAPDGIKNCLERGECIRTKKKVKNGTQLEISYCLCGEQNAILQAAKLGRNIKGSTMYCTHSPCPICTRLIIGSGIKRFVYKDSYPNEFSLELFNEAGVKCEQVK